MPETQKKINLLIFNLRSKRLIPRQRIILSPLLQEDAFVRAQMQAADSIAVDADNNQSALAARHQDVPIASTRRRCIGWLYKPAKDEF